MSGMTSLAVIGLGAMGARFAGRFLEAGHEVIVWNRTPEKAEELVSRGASAATSPAEAARTAEAVFTVVSDPEALRAVTEGPDGIAAGANASTTVIEMSTVGPRAVRWLETALPPGVGLLDAPVLGSLSEVESGTLLVFVGGPRRLVERWIPLFGTLGSVFVAGPLGSGAAAKLVANASLVGTLALLGETIALRTDSASVGGSRWTSWRRRRSAWPRRGGVNSSRPTPTRCDSASPWLGRTPS